MSYWIVLLDVLELVVDLCSWNKQESKRYKVNFVIKGYDYSTKISQSEGGVKEDEQDREADSEQQADNRSKLTHNVVRR
jgi:hypothetical protein